MWRNLVILGSHGDSLPRHSTRQLMMALYSQNFWRSAESLPASKLTKMSLVGLVSRLVNHPIWMIWWFGKTLCPVQQRWLPVWDDQINTPSYQAILIGFTQGLTRLWSLLRAGTKKNRNSFACCLQGPRRLPGLFGSNLRIRQQKIMKEKKVKKHLNKWPMLLWQLFNGPPPPRCDVLTE